MSDDYSEKKFTREETVFQKKLHQQKKVVENISAWLESKGYARGMHGFCDHKTGLPKIPNVLVRPTYADHSGSRTIMVTPTELIVADIAKPYHENQWAVSGREPYETTEDLKSKLDNLVYAELGTWVER
tara:strand:+ start:148 stop:534 length:387 start_codon:yes stop_codon:yes gene_type:complete